MRKINEIFVDINGRDEKLCIVNAKRSDTARSIKMNLLDEGSPLNLNNIISIQLGCKKSNKGRVIRTPEVTFIDKSKGVFSFDILSSDIDTVGKMDCEIILTDNNGTITSGTFYIMVFPLAIDGSDLLTSQEYRDFEEEYARLMAYGAKDIEFDNLGTGMSATNVQEAYEELKALYTSVLADYNLVFQEVDKHRLDLISILNQKRVPVLSTDSDFGTIVERTKEIRGTTPNIFIQQEEPTLKKGIWIKRDPFYYEIFTCSSYSDSMFTGRGNGVILVRNESGSNVYWTELLSNNFTEEGYTNTNNIGHSMIGFNKVYYRYNGVNYNPVAYYGDGLSWIRISQ